MFRRLPAGIDPSHHAVRATCVEILPLIEMYCKYDLQDNCGDLRALMLRFDSEAVLEHDVLGHALLSMLRDEDVGLQIVPPRPQSAPRVNPFDAVRSSLAAVDLAFQGLRAQVHSHLDDFYAIPAAGMEQVPSAASFRLCSVFGLHQPFIYKFCFQGLCFPSAIHSCPCKISV